MRRILLPLFFAAALLPRPLPLRAEAGDGNARALLDAYLAQAALEVPAYRADLQAGGVPGRTPPGRLSGVSPLLGPFTYRPKTFGELTRAQRTALLLDPKWRAFLLVTNEQKHRAGPAALPSSHPPRLERFSVAPAEMLKPGPLFVALPPAVISPEDFPDGLDPQKLAEALAIVHEQVATALWLSAGMLLAFAAIACAALHWRRFALGFGFFYSLTLCFVHNGHAQIIGPLGCAIALAGLVWPGK